MEELKVLSTVEKLKVLSTVEEFSEQAAEPKAQEELKVSEQAATPKAQEELKVLSPPPKDEVELKVLSRTRAKVAQQVLVLAQEEPTVWVYEWI